MGKRKRLAASRLSVATTSTSSSPFSPLTIQHSHEDTVSCDDDELAAAKAAAFLTLECTQHEELKASNSWGNAVVKVNGDGKKKRAVHESCYEQDEGALLLSGSEMLETDAFYKVVAAVQDEYNWFHHTAGERPTLPSTAKEKLAASVLYYGEVSRSTKSFGTDPKLTFTRLKHTVSDDQPPTKHIIRHTDASDLDEDEYIDVFGTVPQYDSSFAVIDHALDYEDEEEHAKQRGLEDCDVTSMDLGDGSPPPDPPPPLNHVQEVDPQPTSAPLTGQQQQLLSNALSAQYWAGYHSALLYQSLDVKLNDAAQVSRVPHFAGDGWSDGWQAASAKP